MNLRPDEMAFESERDRSEKFDRRLAQGANLVKNAGLTAAGVGLSSKILPFLSEYITPDLAFKGISKISPKLGRFLKDGQKMGLDLKGGLDFLKEKIGQSQSNAAQKNVVEQYSPELHSFLTEKIGSGMTPIQAGALAYNDKKFKDVISKLIKDHKRPFGELIETIYSQGPRKNMPDEEQQTEQIINQGANPSSQNNGSGWSDVINSMKSLLDI